MKVDRTAELQVQNLKQREQGADKVATARHQEAQATDKVDLATPVRIGQQVIYVSLSKSLSLNGKAFDPSASAKSSELDGKVEPTEDNPLGFDYKTVAKNVLGFVTGYIKLAQSQGKDDQERARHVGAGPHAVAAARGRRRRDGRGCRHRLPACVDGRLDRGRVLRDGLLGRLGWGIHPPIVPDVRDRDQVGPRHVGAHPRAPRCGPSWGKRFLPL